MTAVSGEFELRFADDHDNGNLSDFLIELFVRDMVGCLINSQHEAEKFCGISV